MAHAEAFGAVGTPGEGQSDVDRFRLGHTGERQQGPTWSAWCHGFGRPAGDVDGLVGVGGGEPPGLDSVEDVLAVVNT